MKLLIHLRKKKEYEENTIKNSENSNAKYNIVNCIESKNDKCKMDINYIFETQMKNSNLNLEEMDIKKSDKKSEKNVITFGANVFNADNANGNFSSQKIELVEDSIYNSNLLQNNSKMFTNESINKSNMPSQNITYTENQKNTQISNKFKSINTSIKPQLDNNIGGIAKIPEEKEEKNSFDDK